LSCIHLSLVRLPSYPANTLLNVLPTIEFFRDINLSTESWPSSSCVNLLSWRIIFAQAASGSLLSLLIVPIFFAINIDTRGVQNNLKPKIRTENSIPESNFRIPKPKYLIFSVRVPEPIIFSGYRFGYRSHSLTKWIPENPKFFYFLFLFLKSTGPKNLFVNWCLFPQTFPNPQGYLLLVLCCIAWLEHLAL